jgi:hypothetical protein
LLIRIGQDLDAEDDFPLYKDGIYDSALCIPSDKEMQLYSDVFENRSDMTYRAALDEIQINYQSTEKAVSWIESKFTKTDKIEDLSLCFIARYNQSIGLKVAVDSAQNLAKKRPSFVIASLNPPAVLYDPYAEDEINPDNVRFTRRLNVTSSLRSPTFNDGYWVRHRSLSFHTSTFCVEI